MPFYVNNMGLSLAGLMLIMVMSNHLLGQWLWGLEIGGIPQILCIQTLVPWVHSFL